MWKTENVANFLLKGKQIYLEGRIETRSYEDKEGQKKYITEVICDDQQPGASRWRRPRSAPGDSDASVSMPRAAGRPQAAAPPPRPTT